MLLALPLLPLLALVLYNRIDEAPNSDVRYFESLSQRQVADQDNAWLHLMGIGAAVEGDPVAYGRQRWQAYEQWLEQSKSREAFLPAPEALPVQAPSLSTHGFDNYCDDRSDDCLVWALTNGAALYTLADANRTRLQRFEQLLALSEWQDLATPSLEEPFPAITEAALRSGLIALELARGGVDDGEALAYSLNRLAQEVEFWHRVTAQPQELVTVLRAARRIEQLQRIAGSVLDRLDVLESPALNGHFDRIFAARALPADFSLAIGREYRLTELGFRQAIPGLISSVGQCLDGSAQEGCLKGLMISATYNHSATMNLHAIHKRLILRLLQAPAAEIDQVKAQIAPRFEATFVSFEDPSSILQQMSYNYSGRILAQIAVPAFDYHYRLYDQEALRRMWQVKLCVLRDGAGERVIKRCIEQSELRDPYTGSPFDWDAENGALRFAVRAQEYWPEQLHVVLLNH
ncbi:hypothetical protein [Pseudomarimonas arenosa]|uniref:Uncharacterized protein n=1 Tax=Pseudomarimonas arenosa TaxID=2774145 RepID=A0AAW3ZGS2_9GAMM|nr:hypothetical protein [Pseudomarimonas arenosa]MBD8524630.1 hypothetical protein [Pseudomarimonas arenosa]